MIMQLPPKCKVKNIIQPKGHKKIKCLGHGLSVHFQIPIKTFCR